MRILPLTAVFIAALTISCSNQSSSSASQETRTVGAGERASIGHLTYMIVDNEVLAKIGDGDKARVPKDRFIILQIAVTNNGSGDSPIPAVELVSDSGQTYGELGDGEGVPMWLGISRKVGSTQTERGTIVFDAPAAHYKVRFSDEEMRYDILADLPLSYLHEASSDILISPSALPEPGGASGFQAPKSK